MDLDHANNEAKNIPEIWVPIGTPASCHAGKRETPTPPSSNDLLGSSQRFAVTGGSSYCFLLLSVGELYS